LQVTRAAAGFGGAGADAAQVVAGWRYARPSFVWMDGVPLPLM
jgi:hypothetical protein